ncbi:MAG: phage shock protein A [Bradymonadia bacterium]
MDREYQNLLDAIDRAEEDAVVALESREEERARRFLERKATLERDAEKVRLDRDDARDQLYQLRGALQSLQDRVGLGGRSEPGRGPREPSLGSIERELESALESPAFDHLSELEGRIADIEARAEADIELLDPLHDPREVAIDEEFRRLSAHQQLNELRDSADEESALDRLRRLMNED